MVRSYMYTAVDAYKRSAQPLRLAAEMSAHVLRHPLNPASYTLAGKSMAAALDLFEQSARDYPKPEFGISSISVYGQPVDVREETVWSAPFCELVHFRKDETVYARLRPRFAHPKVLIVAPMSGHYATLLRGTVAAMLPEHDVFITDWVNARDVPLRAGRFGLDDYAAYVRAMIRHLGPGVHVMAVCQPGPACLAAAAMMHEDGEPAAPVTLTILGSPIDARRSPTAPNKLSETRKLDWFKRNMVHKVPLAYAGAGRMVYPGFLQLTAFIEMNRNRHLDAHYQHYLDMVRGDGDSVQKHREFYDEYLAVMDISAEFYIETVDRVFQRFELARGEFEVHGRKVRPEAITRMGLMTVEGENDDISGIGQTQAAHALCSNIPAALKADYIQPGVGHYGVFNGTRWRTEIQPRIRDFMRMASASLKTA